MMYKNNKNLKVKILLIKKFFLIIIVYICFFITACNKNDNSKVKEEVKEKFNFNVATISKIKKERIGIVVEKNGGKFLYDENGNLLKNYLYKLGDDYYYANKNGLIVNSTFVAIDARTKSNVKLNNTEEVWYYFESTGKAIKNRSSTIDGKKYYFDNLGRIMGPLPDSLKEVNTKNLYAKNIGDTVIFGSYEVKSNGEYVYLIWDVLDKKEDMMLIATCYIIDEKQIEIDYKWENSKIRSWLNNDFYNKAFKKDEEIEKICDTILWTDGKVTKDKIFLLSEYEFNKYYKDSLDEYKTTIATNKTLRKGLYYDYENDKSPYCLRDSINGDIKIVAPDSKIYLSKNYNININEIERKLFEEYELDEEEYNNEGGHYIYEFTDYNMYGIRPAMWIKY